MSTIRRSVLARTSVSLFCALLLLTWGLPVYAVTITAPKPNARVSKVIHIAATPAAGETYTYAILLVDNEHYGMTNVAPMRFEVDTTQLANGPHVLQINLADVAGILSRSKVVRVVVTNPLPPGSAAPQIATLLPPAAPVSTAKVPKTAVPQPAQQPVATIPTSAPKSTITPTAAPIAATPAQSAAPRSIRGAELGVVLDGTPMLTVQPTIDRGRAMVLLRPLVEALGGKLVWDSVKRQAIAEVDGCQYVFSIGENTATINGLRAEIDRSVIIVTGRTVVPVTVWRDLFGGTIKYDREYGCISLNSRPKQIMPDGLIASK